MAPGQGDRHGGGEQGTGLSPLGLPALMQSQGEDGLAQRVGSGTWGLFPLGGISPRVGWEWCPSDDRAGQQPVCKASLSGGEAEGGWSRGERAPQAGQHRGGVSPGQDGAYLVEGGDVMDRRPRVTWLML